MWLEPLEQRRYTLLIAWQNSFCVGAVDGAQFFRAEHFARGQAPHAFHGCSVPVIGAVEDLRNRYDLAQRSESDRVRNLRRVVIHFSQLTKHHIARRRVLYRRFVLPFGHDARDNFR